ncbi:hypothetical protein L596_006593 [Steinernema carpocapsae]|uniref:Uncharacterized protein n=1 Tax=Steinernema carpocapsae TaxID=34508 RepID=A0A4U8V2U1_STECR|nr:hypothetical protein L596_006593 [Steinernema carpocapsae]
MNAYDLLVSNLSPCAHYHFRLGQRLQAAFYVDFTLHYTKMQHVEQPLCPRHCFAACVSNLLDFRHAEPHRSTYNPPFKLQMGFWYIKVTRALTSLFMTKM